jgi:hypothetical protein
MNSANWAAMNAAEVIRPDSNTCLHLPAYLDEFAFRFNNRKSPHLFRDTLLRG